MRLLVLSDLHYVPYETWQAFLKISQDSFDLILLLGDIEVTYLRDISSTFSNKPILGVHGNHDYPIDLESFSLPNLHGKTILMQTHSFLGIEGCVRYKKGNRPMYTQEEISQLLEQIPPVDIVISHNSPKGIHDKEKLSHEGFQGLTDYILTKKPMLVFHGHQHINSQTKIQNTLVIGVFGGVIFDLNKRITELVLPIDDSSN